MTILQIAILVVLAIIIGHLPKGRQLGMLAVSALVVFWLQPAQPFVSLQYWLPLATLSVAALTWVLTSTPEVRGWRQNWPAVLVLGIAVVLGESGRYIESHSGSGTLSTLRLLLVALAVVAVLALVLLRWRRAISVWMSIAMMGILLVLVFLKAPALTQAASAYLARAAGAVHPNASTALSWLGFSYVAFRLMHTIRDRQSGRMPSVTLGEYVNYVLFFPSFTAGPIDRIERFLKDLCNPLRLGNEDWIEAGTRLFVGLFKKFVIADLLAVISMNDVLVARVHSAAWMWVFLYAYAFRIYFDFSGYTDIAIGMGRLMGIRLPENFVAPYLKPNLTQFWNSWHMTLTQWFRAYVFNPFTRAMRAAKKPLPVWAMILIAQLVTMTLIGLWHGITTCFVLWGLWHGIGLFTHNRWNDFIRPRTPAWMQSGRGQWLANAAGVVLTFNYVAISWVFFSLSTPELAWLAIQKLFRLA